MAAIKSLLIRITTEVTDRKRICHHNRKNHSITAGELCLVTIDDMGGKKNYCHLCADQMIKKVQAEIRDIENLFSVPKDITRST